MSRPLKIIGNWKMHKTRSEASEFISQLSQKIDTAKKDIYLAVPATALASCAFDPSLNGIQIGAQTISEFDKGAFTGEISAEMVKEAGACFVIIGHSERRTLFHETSLVTSIKIKKALDHGLFPILCIGESKAEKQEGITADILKGQLRIALSDLSKEEMKYVSIAYEPLWAVGTGLPAKAEDAQHVHSMCREFIRDCFGENIAEGIHLLYGGSVNDKNIAEFLKHEDIDGVLIGGASLDVEPFAKIITISRDMNL